MANQNNPRKVFAVCSCYCNFHLEYILLHDGKNKIGIFKYLQFLKHEMGGSLFL